MQAVKSCGSFYAFDCDEVMDAVRSQDCELEGFLLEYELAYVKICEPRSRPSILVFQVHLRVR